MANDDKRKQALECHARIDAYRQGTGVVAPRDSVKEGAREAITRAHGGAPSENNPPLTAQLLGDVAHGSLTLNTDGTYTYTPDADYNGTDSFTFKANDGALDSNVATISLTIDPVNDAPVAQDGSARGNEDTKITGSVAANDVDHDPLTYALVDAKKRGVHVEVLLDRSNETERYSDLHIFLEQGLAPLIDANHAIAHNKVMIIDQKVLITGSYNFTNQAEEENAENLLIIKGHPELVAQYRQNFLAHKSHSKPAQLKQSADPPVVPIRKAA